MRMTSSSSTPIDLLTVAGTKPQTVKQRIDQRLTVLREWNREGIPMGKEIPTSLTAAREWDDAELGILSIRSPNEFTTNHRVHGTLVGDISKLLTALKKRHGRPAPSSSVSSSAGLNKFDRQEIDRQLEAAVSQWHSERDQRLHEKARADASDARSVVLLEENAQKDKLIADLRRQLAVRQGLRSVE